MKKLVLLSGGLDSTLCLHKVVGEESTPFALFFDYGQRGRALEWKYSRKQCELAGGVELKEVRMGDLFQQLSDSALVHVGKRVEMSEGHLPSVFLPARNAIFFSLAAAYASMKGISTVVSGIVETQFSYPDTTQDFKDSIEGALRTGLGESFTIETPLMGLSKGGIVKEALKFFEPTKFIKVLSNTVSCDKGLEPVCGECPSCLSRATGFRGAGLLDPLLEKFKRALISRPQ